MSPSAKRDSRSQRRTLGSRLLITRVWIFHVLIAMGLLVGCDSKPSGTRTSSLNIGTESGESLEAGAIASLESKPDFEQCRLVLRQLDGMDRSLSERGELPDETKKKLIAFFRMNPDDQAELEPKTFTAADALYLEESLFLAAAMRSLDIRKLPPLERAQRSFEWACRVTYIDDRFQIPGTAWYSLQSGLSSIPGRCNVVLALWRQLGVDGLIVGPDKLKSSPTIAAPVKYLAAAIDGQLYLFDPATGKPVLDKEGKSVTTLAQLGNAELKPFVFASIPAFTPRMQYLEKQIPELKLTVDPLALQAKYQAEAACSMPNDAYSPLRIYRMYALDEGSKTEVPLAAQHRFSLVPPMPKLELYGEISEVIRSNYYMQFTNLRLGLNSPMDRILRGNFKDATAYLSDVKSKAELAADRYERDPNLRKDFAQWAKEVQSLDAAIARATRTKDNSAIDMSRRALQDYLKNPRNADILYVSIMGTASAPLLAEATYLLCLCVHEKAEQAALRGLPTAEMWNNASEWWTRYETAALKLPGQYPQRDAHAKALATRAAGFIRKSTGK